MKELTATIKALRAKAKELELAAKALEKLDNIGVDYNYNKPQRRNLTAKGRKNISMAQKKRWNVVRGGKKAA